MKKYTRDLRVVLEDEAEEPRFIETVYGRGYRFIASITHTLPAVSGQFSGVSTNQVGTTSPQLATHLVGRDTEIAQLRTWLHKALSGQRQLVFMTGEPGLGKTTLVDAFLQQAASEERLWIGRGQCIEHYSSSEAYLPVLEAFGRLCHAPGGARVIATLRQHAPLWLAQLPSVLEAAEHEALQRQVAGATPERMLREMAQAIEELTVEQPLVLWLEDLHGSDYATLDLLAFLARRREAARLLVLGTYRPLAVRNGEHPLPAIQHELQVRGQCQELALQPLREDAVAAYLEVRFSAEAMQTPPLQRWAQVIHQRTEGNPLFMVSVVETVLRQEGFGAGIEVVSQAVPTYIRHFIEQQVEQLKGEEREVLEAASVAGRECSAAAIAAGLDERVEEIENRCGSLARREHFIRASGIEEWPDGMVATRYRFVHRLYQEVLYERVTAARQVSLHRRIGARLEHGYGQRAGAVAAELAMHYERGRDSEHAVRYLYLAGETALRRHAYREAATFLTKGVALLQTLPATPERLHQELTLHIALGPALTSTKGWGNADVEKVYSRARELCQQVGNTPQLASVLQGLCLFSLVWAEYQTAHELGKQLLRLAQEAGDSALLLKAHFHLGETLYLLGELTAAQEHLEEGLALYDPRQHHAWALLSAQDPGIGSFVVAAFVLWPLGYPDQAVARAEAALTLARTPADPFNLGLALVCRAVASQHCHRFGQGAQWTEEVMALSSAQGFPLWSAGGLIFQGAMLAHRGQSVAGIDQMKQGLATFEATGALVARTYLLALLAEAYGVIEQPEEGLAVLAEALVTVDNTGERYYEAELWRLKGQLTLQCKGQNVKCKIPTSPLASHDNSSSSALASWRSAVSNPSVNQP